MKKANTPKASNQTPLQINSSKITLQQGTANNEHIATAVGRTFLVYRSGVPVGKKIALTVESHTTQHNCDEGTVFLLDPGVKIGIPTREECYPDTIKFLRVTVSG